MKELRKLSGGDVGTNPLRIHDRICSLCGDECIRCARPWIIRRELGTISLSEGRVADCERWGQAKALLLHCYPSDLKVGAGELVEAVRNFDVRLIDMGHIHYNEIAKDGRTLYSATRSTGQIEEGPVGYSATNIDGDIVSWRFVELGQLPVVVTGDLRERERVEDDRDNALEAWPEHGLLGTQLGLNKNRKKW